MFRRGALGIKEVQIATLNGELIIDKVSILVHPLNHPDTPEHLRACIHSTRRTNDATRRFRGTNTIQSSKRTEVRGPIMYLYIESSHR